ncbi:MAG: hypothetical protein H5U07_09305 [Candidatus Aminicenantes bacterium]|nr:hypothetical protein [Candidatus Aminicenantes bacterium]
MKKKKCQKVMPRVRQPKSLRLLKSERFYIFLLIGLTFCLSLELSAQEKATSPSQDLAQLKKTAPKVYIDCGSCDLDYIKTEIPFVNYVRERKEADVHVLITTLRTGSGGREYTLTFLGQNRFAGQDDVLKYFSHQTDTEEEIRSGLTEVLKIGLMTYVNQTPISQKIRVDYRETEPAPSPVKDRWKSWVFSISTGGHFNGEQSHTHESIRGSFSANKVTPDLKFNLTLSASYSHDRYTYEDQNLESSTRSYNGSGLLVKSLGQHWSVGFFIQLHLLPTAITSYA